MSDSLVMRLGVTPEFLEGIANSPEVFPHVTMDGIDKIDLSTVWNDCISVEFPTGGFLFHRQAPGVYEVHTMFKPKSIDAYKAACIAADYMFSNDATLILTQVPSGNVPARKLTVLMGFTKFAEGTIQRNGKSLVSEYFELPKHVWRKSQCQ